MRCVFCASDDTQVKDSRPAEEGSAIRRRRWCTQCDARFTTVERVQWQELVVTKKTGRKEMFDRNKLDRSLKTALRKRPVTEDQREKLVNDLCRRLESSGESEISSDAVGTVVMEALAKLDPVAYIRYASVYKNFLDAKDFLDFVDQLHDQSE